MGGEQETVLLAPLVRASRSFFAFSQEKTCCFRLVANRERFIEERCKGTAAAEVVRRQYVLVPELVMREAGVRGVVQCKQRVMRKRDKKTREEGWGTLVESHRVVEGWIKGGEARRDKAQLRWGKKRGGATFVAQQSGAAMEWTWGDGSVFRGGSDGQGTVETAHGEVLLMKRQEDTKNNSSKHERSVVVSKSGSPRSVVMRAGDVWGTAPSDWPVFGVAKEAES